MSRIREARRESFLTHSWAGGETSEILLLLAGSSHADRSFKVRVSTAVTRAEGARFSDFSGYTRFISPISGTMDLRHEGVRRVLLKPFDIDRFDGGWNTSSYGIYGDFNLLFSRGWTGGMAAAADGERRVFGGMKKGVAGFFAVVPVTLSVDAGQGVERFRLREKDFVYILDPGAESVWTADSGRGGDGGGDSRVGFFVFAEKPETGIP